MSNKAKKLAITSELYGAIYEIQEFMSNETELGKIPEGTYLDFCNMITSQEGLYESIKKLITNIKTTTKLPAVKDPSKRKTKEEILRLAHDPNNKEWDFCPKCSRPMTKRSVKKHQEDTFVCREIKWGRVATLQQGTTRSLQHGNMIADNIDDPNDSDCDLEECLITN